MHHPPGGIVDGHEEEDHIEALETVRNVMTEGRMAGVVDFYIGGDINIQMTLGNIGEDLQGSTASNGMACVSPLAETSTMVTVVERVQLHSGEHLDEQR